MVLMAKTKIKKSVVRKSARGGVSGRGAVVVQETEGVYFLKLVLYLILGSLWLRVTKGTLTIPLPVGLIIGLLLARTDRLAFDRKISYAILLVSMFIGFWLPLGLEFIL